MRLLLAAVTLCSLSACSSVGYYLHTAAGQMGVITATRPVEDVLLDPRTTPAERRRLERLPEIRQFARDALGLPASGSYRLYASVGREALVWSVVAAPFDSLQPRSWCYPVVGCASYRGYFSRDAAARFAEGLRRDGWDVAVEPVPAYSTLGWFSDPLPSTVIDWPLPNIAALVFHELAHEALYVPGDSAFNEAYASLVEREGTRRWLLRHGSAEERLQHTQWEGRRRDFLELLGRARGRLNRIYAAGLPSSALQERKERVFEDLRAEYAALRAGWGEHPGYDRWFDRPLNNAHLASIDTYTALLPAFGGLLQLLDGDMRAFHAACDAIAALPAARRQVYLERLEKRPVPRFSAG
jgi:predicted aminopeptidase